MTNEAVPTTCACCGTRPANGPRWLNRQCYLRLRKRGLLDRYPQKPGRSNPALPPGTRTVTKAGYVNVKLAEDDPLYSHAHNGWMPEHHIVMADMIGRPVRKPENVHHKNGVRGDNRPENLELWAKPQPSGQRSTEARHCPSCTCGAE